MKTIRHTVVRGLAAALLLLGGAIAPVAPAAA